VGHHINLDSKVRKTRKTIESRQPHEVVPSQDVLVLDARLFTKSGRTKAILFRALGVVCVISGPEIPFLFTEFPR
jgi:hypothetical protein